MTIADRLFYLNANAIKSPCRVVSFTNIALSGLPTIDGIAVAAGDRVLVAGQSDSTANGIYVASPDNWIRALDLTNDHDIVEGTLVLINEGTTYANAPFKLEPNT